MNKTLKTVIIVLVAAVLLGTGIGGYFIWRHSNTYIGRDQASQIALGDAGLTFAGVYDIDADFDRDRYGTWYDVDFHTHRGEYEYSIDAVTGEILYCHSESEHAD